jgi:hypothetical protein
MERVMSEQTSILDSIGLLESAVNGWRSLAESSEWVSIAWQLDSPDRDPRQIIAAYDPDNPRGERYRHDGYTAANLRACFVESDYRRALAVEEALIEHCPIVIRFLQQLDSQEAGRCAEKMMKFLADRRKPDAAILPMVFQVVRQIAVRIEGETGNDDNLPQYVTLDRAAALVQRSKRTLEKAINRGKNPLPDPDIQGTGGRPNEWDWSKIKPWLENEYNRKLPDRFPTLRN